MFATTRPLMGAAEIGERLGGLSRQRVQQILTDPTFPKPAGELRMGKVWNAEDVEAWIREHRTPVGDVERPKPGVRKGRKRTPHPKS